MILKVRNIEKAIRRRKILKGVSMDVEQGEMLGITGENGSGKSTLLKIIIGQWKADKGTITRNARLGYCPQELMLFDYLKVHENLEYFSRAYGLDRGYFENRADILMEKFNYSEYAHTLVSELSGGTKQKLNLSIALLHNPGLLILDEPYNGFDWDTYQVFWDYVDDLRQKGCGIVVVSHLISERSKFSRILQLQKGVFN